MEITISTHNGSSVSLSHNRREPWFVERENVNWQKRHPGEQRIDRNGHFEVWSDSDLKGVYKELFQEAVDDFNARQIKNGHRERVIEDYLQEIIAKEHSVKGARHPMYEMIYAVGSSDHAVEETVTRQILKEIADGFADRNPNLHVIGKYYHADERGIPHLHISYCPVARGCKRGPAVQNSLNKALEGQGFRNISHSETAQMAWERSENDTLERICQKYGYDVVHPMRGGKQEHLSIEEYQLTKKIQDKLSDMDYLMNLPAGKAVVNKSRLLLLERIEKKYNHYKNHFRDNEETAQAAKEAMDALIRARDQLQSEQENFQAAVNDAANQKVQLQKEEIARFLESHHLSQRYQAWIESQHQSQGVSLKK